MGKSKSEDAEALYTAAIKLAEQSQTEEALAKALKLWELVKLSSAAQQLPALNLLGEISVELGNIEEAKEYFQQAVALDPEGIVPEISGGGAEKFLWLAQLCDEGGQTSVDWYERGVKALQTEIADLDNVVKDRIDEESLTLMRVEKKRKLANALCSVIEVYMTDLSWNDDAEARCESLIAQALAVEDDSSAEVLQTLASIRLSQERLEEAQAALKQSFDSWRDLEPEDPAVPDFATKISLTRLLMEAGMENDAWSVVERLVNEDDSSVEAWYLGGWCQYLIAQQAHAKTLSSENEQCDVAKHQRTSRHWLKQSVKLYALLEYEDERLRTHAEELVTELDKILGPEDEEDDDDDDEPIEWNGIPDEDDNAGGDLTMSDA